MSRIVLKNGNVFDSITGRLVNNQTVVIQDRTIHWVGSDDQKGKINAM